MNKYVLDFIYLMPWRFVCDLRFHNVFLEQFLPDDCVYKTLRNLRSETNFYGIKYIKSYMYSFIIII